MDCNETRPLIQDDLDGRLDDAARERLAAHVESCAECRAAAVEFGELRRLFAAVPAVSAPAGFRDSVLAGLPPRGGKLRRMTPWLVSCLAAAAAVIVAVNVIPSSSRTDVASATAPEAAARASETNDTAQPGFADADAPEEPEREARRRATRQELEAVADASAPGREAKEGDDAPAPPAPSAPEPAARDRGAGPPSGLTAKSERPTPPPAPAVTPRADPPAAAENSRKKSGDWPSETTASGLAAFGSARRIVVFSDRQEAERFVAALRGAAAPDGPRASPAPPATARGAAPDTTAADALGRDQADEKGAAARHVATAGASRLAEAAESGSARVLATLPVPSASPRVDALLRDALEGRSWAAPLSERLYARAVLDADRRRPAPADAPTAAGEGGGGAFSGPTTGGGVGGGGGGAGGVGARPQAGGKDDATEADPEAESAESADAAQRAPAAGGRLGGTGKSAALEIIVLVLDD